MRNAMLGLLIIPAVTGVSVLGRDARLAVAAPSARSEAFAAQVALALTGSFRAPPQRTALGARPGVQRIACAVNAPGLGARVVYAEDTFEGGSRRPFAQRLLAVDPSAEGAVVREFAPIDPESLSGACDSGVTPTVYRANTVAHEGCEITLRRQGAAVAGATSPSRCESRINDARFVHRSLRLVDDGVEFSERGLDAQGREVWGGASATLRFARR